MPSINRAWSYYTTVPNILQWLGLPYCAEENHTDTVLGITPLHQRNHSDLNCTISPNKIADTHTYIHSTVDRNTVLGIAPLHRRNHSDLNCTIAPKKSQIHTHIYIVPWTGTQCLELHHCTEETIVI